MYERILIPTDGSQGAEKATEHALHLAEHHDAKISALYVIDSRAAYHGVVNVEDRKRLQDVGEKATTKICDAAAERGLEADSHVVRGLPADKILSFSENNEIDLVVMGTHGRSGFRRFILGSTTDKVVRQSDAPVLTVPINGHGE